MITEGLSKVIDSCSPREVSIRMLSTTYFTNSHSRCCHIKKKTVSIFSWGSQGKRIRTEKSLLKKVRYYWVHSSNVLLILNPNFKLARKLKILSTHIFGTNRNRKRWSVGAIELNKSLFYRIFGIFGAYTKVVRAWKIGRNEFTKLTLCPILLSTFNGNARYPVNFCLLYGQFVAKIGHDNS